MALYYMVEEAELKDLFKAYHKLTALERGGVDNWSWHSDSLYYYLDGYAKNIGITDEKELIDFDFDSIAKRELSKYRTVGVYFDETEKS
jgi:hypothetical protein